VGDIGDARRPKRADFAIAPISRKIDGSVQGQLRLGKFTTAHRMLLIAIVGAGLAACQTTPAGKFTVANGLSIHRADMSDFGACAVVILLKADIVNAIMIFFPKPNSPFRMPNGIPAVITKCEWTRYG
jgi:hypothetical protein